VVPRTQEPNASAWTTLPLHLDDDSAFVRVFGAHGFPCRRGRPPHRLLLSQARVRHLFISPAPSAQVTKCIHFCSSAATATVCNTAYHMPSSRILRSLHLLLLTHPFLYPPSSPRFLLHLPSQASRPPLPLCASPPPSEVCSRPPLCVVGRWRKEEARLSRHPWCRRHRPRAPHHGMRAAPSCLSLLQKVERPVFACSSRVETIAVALAPFRHDSDVFRGQASRAPGAQFEVSAVVSNPPSASGRKKTLEVRLLPCKPG
jgi:hypothetical protein